MESRYEIWNNYMQHYDFLTKIDGYAENLNDIASAAGVQPRHQVLDAGSGTGNLSVLLKTKGAEVMSCDYSQSAIECHRTKDPSANILQLSLEETLPFEDSQFDAVCCASVLFTLSKTGGETAIAEFFRVLKPGGRLVVTTAAPQTDPGNLLGMHYSRLVKHLGRVSGSIRFLFDMPNVSRIVDYTRQLSRLPDWQGFHCFNETELRSLVAQFGFGEIQVRKTYGGCFLLLECRK